MSDRPQRWAAVPAAAMAIAGAGLIVLAPSTTALGWVWPPLLLALVVWMTVHVRRQPSSRLQPWLLCPVFGVLALAAIAGYEALGNASVRSGCRVWVREALVVATKEQHEDAVTARPPECRIAGKRSDSGLPSGRGALRAAS